MTIFVARVAAMFNKVLTYCAGLSGWRVFLFGLLLAMPLEAVTAWLRFGLGKQSTRDTGAIGTMTFGLRIHHGYVGIVLLLVAWAFFGRSAGWRNAFLIVGLALVVSDLAHHFLVLWPITGSPHFDLVYPKAQNE